MPDPRDVRGRRYPAVALLCTAVAAVLTGTRSLIAISEWVVDAPQHVLGALGFGIARSPACGPCRTPPRCGVCCNASTATRWTRRSVRICRPGCCHHPRPRGSSRCGR
ncbi:transposase family protein [Streptomyces sp. NPDC002088]|uniref:transposase family protein n=1 Tax=Streptomyces sp. NPDC002088 TaxID=3154665 RepID=UPI003326A42A